MAFAGRVLWIVNRVIFLIKESKHPGDTVLTTEIVPLINACGKMLASRRLLKTTVQLDLVADTNTIAYPADYMESDSFFWTEDHTPIEKVGDRARFHNLNQIATEGARIYAVHPARDTLIVWPTPTASTTAAIDMLYYQNWTDVTETDPPNAVGTVTTIAVGAGGTGYTTGNVLTVAAPTGGTAATVTVSHVTAGVVDGVTLLTAGSGYTTGVKTTGVTPAGGSGCTINVTATGTGVIDPITPASFDMLFVYYALREIFRTKRGGKTSGPLAALYDGEYAKQEQQLFRRDRGSQSVQLDR